MTELNDKMHLTILTPEAEKFRGDTVNVVLPGHDGLLGILPNHAPLLCNLDIGLVRFLDTDKVQHGFMLDGGFAHIRDNQIMVLTRKAIGSDEITTTQAEERLKRAKELPKTNLKEVDGRNAAIKRAKLYIDLASLK